MKLEEAENIIYRFTDWDRHTEVGIGLSQLQTIWRRLEVLHIRFVPFDYPRIKVEITLEVRDDNIKTFTGVSFADSLLRAVIIATAKAIKEERL